VSGGSNAPTGSPQWRQKYAYDRFGNRSGVAWDTSGGLIIPSNVPLDGLATLAFTDGQGKVLTNRITTSGYAYDSAGNQTSGQAPDGSSQSYKYDAAGRLAEVKITGGAVLATYSYGAGNERLIASENGGAVITYYAWSGGQVIAEYQQSGSALSFQKGYVYMGGRLLLTENTSGDRQYHHANRLGTQLVTNASTGAVVSEQIGLPYGTMLPSDSIQYGDGSYQLQNNQTKRRFTSYDRSSATGLDYAINRTYNSGQGRFTQVDPIGMKAVQLGAPQTLNLYSYCANDPVNHLDPDGLFFGFLIGLFVAVFGAIGTAIAVVAKVIVEVLLTVVVSIVNAVGTLLVNLFDKVPWLKSVLISGFASEQGVSTWRILIHSAAIAGAGAVSAFAQGKKPGTEETQADVNLKTAIEDALEALRRNKNCKKLLEANGMDPEIVLESLRRNRRFAIRDIGHRGQTVDQKTGGSGQGRGTNASIIMDNRNLTDDGLARNAMAEIYDPRISRAVTVLHEVGHATGAVPYSREQGHTGTFGGEQINNDPDKINNRIGVTCFPGKVKPK
jgi:RHS repeat-associated protein